MADIDYGKENTGGKSKLISDLDNNTSGPPSSPPPPSPNYTPCQTYLGVANVTMWDCNANPPIWHECLAKVSWTDPYTGLKFAFPGSNLVSSTTTTQTSSGILWNPVQIQHSGAQAVMDPPGVTLNCSDLRNWWYGTVVPNMFGSPPPVPVGTIVGCEWVESEINRIFDILTIGTVSGTPLIQEYISMNCSPWTTACNEKLHEIAQWQLKIAALNCVLGSNNPCCGLHIAGGWNWDPDCGCTDNGNMPLTYQNNNGGFGSVTPPDPALNYDPAAPCDDGSCIYPEQIPHCGCAEPSSVNFLGHLFPSPGYPVFGVHNSFFRDCVGNVVGSQSYLNVGPYGDTSCCDRPNDRLYNYRDVYIAKGTKGDNEGWFRGVGMDGGTGSMGVNPTRNPDNFSSNSPPPGDQDFEGVIGLDWFVIRPNLKDVHGNVWKQSDFHTSPDTGWTIQIYDQYKNYLGTWHYDRCVAYQKSPDPNSGAWIQNTGQQQTTPPVHYNEGIMDSIGLFLYGPTHIDGPDPVVNYGNSKSLLTLSGQLAAIQYNIVDRSTVPRYYENNYHVHSATFAYIKIVTDYNYDQKECIPTPPETPLGEPTFTPDPHVPNLPPVSVLNPDRLWFEDIDTGPNTSIDRMQVVCLPPSNFRYDNTLQPQSLTCPSCPPPSPPDLWPWGTIGTSGCIGNGAYSPWQTWLCDQLSFANPNYNIRVMSHFLHPWAASHRQVPVYAIWYQNLHSGNIGCGGYRPVVGPQP